MESNNRSNDNDVLKEFTKDEENSIIDAYMRGERYNKEYSISLSNGKKLNFELTMPFIADWREGENIVEESKNPGHDNNLYLIAMYVTSFGDKDFKKDGKAEYSEDAVKERMNYLENRLIEPLLVAVMRNITSLKNAYSKIFNVENLTNF